MKIAYLAEGYNVHDRRFLEKLVERGHEPYLIAYHTHELLQVPGVQNLDFTKLFDFRFYAHCVPRRRYWQFWRMGRHLARVLHKLQPDILHTGYLRWHGLIGALANFPRTLSMPWGSDVLIEPQQAQFTAWAATLTLRRAQRITCDCELVKQRIIELTHCAPEKIVVFPWGIDLQTFHPCAEGLAIRQRLGWEQNDLLIMTRNFKPVYGIEYFLQALPAIIAQQPNTRVILIGTGPLEASLKEQIREAGLTAYIHFTGRVNEQEMVAYLSAADVYVTTALSDGTSVSMLEAMACGLPLVVSDAPAYDEWITPGVNGMRAKRADVAAIQQAILTLLENACLRKQMGETNLKIARAKADWEANFTTLEQIYTDLMKIRTGTPMSKLVSYWGLGRELVKLSQVG
ncbi:MAG: glycosyltransferase family 1 protein [Caldilinea sp. CFX5]|nr:glycosyltransferase family 1 protein [Caldilinea sp. CFX5]